MSIRLQIFKDLLPDQPLVGRHEGQRRIGDVDALLRRRQQADSHARQPRRLCEQRGLRGHLRHGRQQEPVHDDSRRHHRNEIAVRVAKEASYNGIELPEYSHPVIAVPHYPGPGYAPETPFVLAWNGPALVSMSAYGRTSEKPPVRPQ